MLFINRRGYSSFVSCRSCGEAVKCPTVMYPRRCTIVSGWCVITVATRIPCRSCARTVVLRIWRALASVPRKSREMAAQMFPEAKLLRMDLTPPQRRAGHEKILSAFAREKADILIGTRMIVKGHDFPGVTLVGVLAADVKLPVCAGFSAAAERTFQLWFRQPGAPGGRKAGTARIQTYMPEHTASRRRRRLRITRPLLSGDGLPRLMHYPPRWRCACRRRRR